MKAFAGLLLAVILAAPLSADVLRIIEDPVEAAQLRVDMIEQAESDVSAMYFIVRNDRITIASLALLREARRRGVPSVRLLADANFTRIPKPLLAHLRDEGVQIRVYHPIRWNRPGWLFKRMHEKMMVVDGRRYVAGGRNLAEAYFGQAERNYVDRDVYVDGISAAEAMHHFEAVWKSRHVADLHVRVREEETAAAARQLDIVLEQMRAGTTFVCLDTKRDWSEGAADVGDVHFVHDPVGRRGLRVANQISPILGDATSSIVIESPYLVPSRPVLKLLEKKLAEGVRIVIITNSMQSTDAAFPYAAYLKYRRRLHRAGIELYEYRGPDMLHAKSFIVDGRTIGIGSYNLDPRSQNLNTEVMCVVENEEVARELQALFDTHIAHSWRVGEPRDGAGRLTFSRRAWGWAAQILVVAPVLENQL